MAKLDKKYAPFVEEAKQAYIRYCDDMPEGMRNYKKARNIIKHYDALKEYYDGVPIADLTASMGYTHTSTARNTLGEVQNRIRLYLQES